MTTRITLDVPQYRDAVSGRAEFSVYQFFKDGSYERVRSHVTAEEAIKAAAHYTSCVGARLGTTCRVIITDGGDFTCFEWKYGEGVVFPPKDEVES